MTEIKPHGGKLVDRTSTADPSDLPSYKITKETADDLENIADGVFSPLEGFLNQDDFEAVVTKGRLANDIPWTIPIILDTDKETSLKMKDEKNILLVSPTGIKTAILHVEDAYTFDKQRMSSGVFGTSDPTHPGVAQVSVMNDYLVSGKIDYLQRPTDSDIRNYRMTPQQTRAAFQQAGWKSIAAFQTRNPPHVAHEMLQKISITTRDGVFVNPLVGKKKTGDFVDEVIVKCYEAMIKNYYPPNRCKLATLHTEMRYAGPKEAIHHAILRQNYGCTHIIIGRDHAGVGKFYGPFMAQEIFSDYPDLEISPLFFPAFFYCKECLTFVNSKICPHGDDAKEQISGSLLREMIKQGKTPSQYILRPQVSEIILNHPKPFVD